MVARDLEVAPFLDPVRNTLVAGDVRLYNAEEVRRALGVPASEPLSDLALAYRGYLQWGEDVPARLVGDFAFSVWNEGSRSLFAARDQLGVRPLYYRWSRERVSSASDVRQLLPPAGSRIALDEDQILDSLAKGIRRHGKTFFRDITLLRPGHILVATSRGIAQRRYWFPPAIRQDRSYRETCEELKATFKRAVRDRLESDRPIIAHSSGGFDSTTIVMAADEIYREDSGRPPLWLASALAPGAPCDDGVYIEAVTRHVPFAARTWSAFETELGNIIEPTLASPGLRVGPGGGPRRDLELAREVGARVLIAGVGGDDVRAPSGIFRDMAANGRWLELIRDPTFRGSLRRTWRGLPRAALGFLPPSVVTSLVARRRTKVLGPPPAWAGPALRASWPPPPENLELIRRAWPSHVASELWARVTRPHVAGIIHHTSLYGAHEGLEVRLPYLDVRVVELFLSVPWHDRIPHGNLRRLAHDALTDYLPPELLLRRGQGSWRSVWSRNFRGVVPSIEALMRSGDWLAAPYVDRGGARQLVDRVAKSSPDDLSDEVITLLRIGSLEAWLRALAGAGFRV
ncbi:MAG TPA: asparagine synthase-related protein [Polyangia bacterium]|nr:asparagine synthase-related protein [Polyangia bacterium]